MNRIDKRKFLDIDMWCMGSYWFGEPKMFVYSFLVDGLLIDTGQPNIQKIFLSALSDEEISQCVVTHHHEDHSGNADAIKNNFNIEVFGSPKCAEILKSPPKVSPAQSMSWGQNSRVDLTPLDLNEVVKTNKYTFQIIETPGHAVDMIALYESNEGWLFSADNYVNSFINIFMRNENILDQINSLRSLIKLDFDVLFCSHYPQFKNGKAHLKSKLEFLVEYYHRIENHYQKGYSPKIIMESLRLKESNVSKWLSLGELSQENMVKSVIRSIEDGGIVSL